MIKKKKIDVSSAVSRCQRYATCNRRGWQLQSRIRLLSSDPNSGLKKLGSVFYFLPTIGFLMYSIERKNPRWILWGRIQIYVFNTNIMFWPLTGKVGSGSGFLRVGSGPIQIRSPSGKSINEEPLLNYTACGGDLGLTSHWFNTSFPLNHKHI